MSVIARSRLSLDPSLQVLILLARLRLTPEQEKSVLELCSEIVDWNELADQAQQRFVLPVVYKHLSRLNPGSLAPDVLALMKRQCMGGVQFNLWVISEQKNLIKDLLQPLNIQHLFFKGYSLSARYYDEPAMRFSRDIDVLIQPDRMVELLEAAFSKGYKPCNPEQLVIDHASLNFLARVQGVITLYSPQGAVIEFHQRIDNTGTIYEARELLSKAELLTLGDIEVPVMPTSELFVYICLHHTKHYWSHLHWLVDIDAIQRHPEFDINEVYAVAKQRNLIRTVESSLELYRALSSPDPFNNSNLSMNGREMLEASLYAMQGGHKVEKELSRAKATPDFSFAWQARTAHCLRWKFLGWIRLFRPSYDDYRSWPLPPKWQWIYPVTRPFRELFTRVASGNISK